MVNMAMNVNNPAETLPIWSPKFNKPTPKDPKITVKFNHDKKVLSLAKNTFGSTRAGRAILLVEDMKRRRVKDENPPHVDQCSVVERNECSDNSQDTPSSSTLHALEQVAGCQNEKSGSQKNEDSTETQSRLQGAQRQHKGEDTPAQQEESNAVGESHGVGSVSSLNAKSWSLNGPVSKPESTVGSQSSGTKSVTNDEFPKSGKQSNSSTVEASKTNDNLRMRDSHGSSIKHT